ncbi:MAG: hypothetical protein M1518_01085, partial [Candidatus Thermoplasmatota archaeon]|nr:hypothetical protein [Candidatus Thermoplasmatota archaeon]
EAEESCKRLGAKVEFLNGTKNTSQLVSMLKEFKPDVIVTHWEMDSHYQHVEVFKMVQGIIPTIVVDHNLSFNLYSCDSYNSFGRSSSELFVPTDFVDVTSVWEEKLELIAIYKSQPVEYWQRMIANQNRLNGARCGVDYAEGYFQIPVLGISRRAMEQLH